MAFSERRGINSGVEMERRGPPMLGELNLDALTQDIVLMGESGGASPLPAPQRFVDLLYLKAAGIQ